MKWRDAIKAKTLFKMRWRGRARTKRDTEQEPFPLVCVKEREEIAPNSNHSLPSLENKYFGSLEIIFGIFKDVSKSLELI